MGKAYFQGICTAVCDTGLLIQYIHGENPVHATQNGKKNFDSVTSHSEPDTKKWHLLQIVLGASRGPAQLTEQTLRHKTQLSLECMDAWQSRSHYLRHFLGKDVISCFITPVCKYFLAGSVRVNKRQKCGTLQVRHRDILSEPWIHPEWDAYQYL